MNTYKKYCPNVFVAKCEEEHAKGETITLTTKYGKEHDCEVHNFLMKDKEGNFYYSITRADGFNSQERAKAKAERLQGYASNAVKRSNEFYKKSNKDKDFLVLGEPIKVGHHSEKRHRKLYEDAYNNMGKSVAESDKAKDYDSRAEYWESRADKIDLSMPESLEYYEFKLEEVTKTHKFLKDNPEKRAHSYSLTYANKAVKDTKKNLDLAVKLWGSAEIIAQIENEKVEQAKAKTPKKKQDLIAKYGGFFAFNGDQLKEGFKKCKDAGHLEEGEKVSHLRHGLYLPCKHVNAFIANL